MGEEDPLECDNSIDRLNYYIEDMKEKRKLTTIEETNSPLRFLNDKYFLERMKIASTWFF